MLDFESHIHGNRVGLLYLNYINIKRYLFKGISFLLPIKNVYQLLYNHYTHD